MRPALTLSETATKRPGDRRYIILTMINHFAYEVRFGLVSADPETWKRRLVMYGINKEDAMERAGVQ